jgi:DnaJ-related protein SCJ1
MCTGRGHANCRRHDAPTTVRRRGGEFLLYMLLVAILLEEATTVLASKDYYELLGVTRDADGASIKRAFRKLAKVHHPDKNPGDSTAEKLYVELNTAYEVLSDSNKRQRYDMFGEAGLKEGGRSGGGGEEDGWGDPFESMFGGFGGGGRRQARQEERRSPDFVVPLSVSLELLYNGGILEASHQRRVVCSSWSECESKCSQCGGSGIVITTRRIGPGFVQQMRSTCPKCGGSGKISQGSCKKCPHGQFEHAEKSLMIDIERGFPDGHRIAFEGQSDELPDHAPGNVYFEVDTVEHPVFRRKGHDLHYDLTVTLTEALVGIDRAVRQLDGRVVPIRTTGVTVPKQQLVIAGEGMPLPDDTFGNMIVHVWVDFPASVTDKQREIILDVHGKVPATEIGNGGGVYDPAAHAKGGGEAEVAKDEL